MLTTLTHIGVKTFTDKFAKSKSVKLANKGVERRRELCGVGGKVAIVALLSDSGEANTAAACRVAELPNQEFDFIGMHFWALRIECISRLKFASLVGFMALPTGKSKREYILEQETGNREGKLLAMGIIIQQ